MTEVAAVGPRSKRPENRRTTSANGVLTRIYRKSLQQQASSPARPQNTRNMIPEELSPTQPAPKLTSLKRSLLSQTLKESLLDPPDSRASIATKSRLSRENSTSKTASTTSSTTFSQQKRLVEAIRLIQKNISHLNSGNELSKSFPTKSKEHGKYVAPSPIYVTKWVDYSNKYGLGYQLSNDTIGVYFNDMTSMLLDIRESTFIYSDHNSKLTRVDSTCLPSLTKKKKIVNHFKSYMTLRCKASNATGPEPSWKHDKDYVFLRGFNRCAQGIAFSINDDTFQVIKFYTLTGVFLTKW